MRIESSKEGDRTIARGAGSRARGLFALAGIAAIALAVGTSGAAALALAGGGLLCVLALVTVQLGSLIVARRSKPRALLPPAPRHTEPRVTIHVPCCNEPPALVIQTLDALDRLDWPDYEVICLDNNTADPRAWKPLEDHCRLLGERFRFHHYERVRGAKAGALNLALELSDPTAEYVAVVDADYCVSPGFLHCAHRYLWSGELSHAQFPQAYRNSSERAGGIVGDHSHYFDVFMPMADQARATLLTGTMLVIRANVLRRVGGWSARTITEDAELGARLAVAGYSGCFVPKVVGRGVMPTALDTLRAQRRRWVHGNAATLFSLRIRDWRRLERAQRIGVVAQLSAWFNGLFVPMLVLAVVGLTTAVVGPREPAHMLAALMSSLAVLTQLAARAAVILLAPRSIAEPRPVWFALVAHLGLAWEGATAWLENLLGVRLAFVRTDKSERAGSVRAGLPALACSAVLVLAGAGLINGRSPIAASGAFAGAAAFAAVIGLAAQLAAPRAR